MQEIPHSIRLSETSLAMRFGLSISHISPAFAPSGVTWGDPFCAELGAVRYTAYVDAGLNTKGGGGLHLHLVFKRKIHSHLLHSAHSGPHNPAWSPGKLSYKSESMNALTAKDALLYLSSKPTLVTEQMKVK